jgi:hypothetical protein
VFFETLGSNVLSPEAEVAMHASLMEYQAFLEKQKRNPQAKVLSKHINHFWQHGNWPLEITIIPLPPGSPI